MSFQYTPYIWPLVLGAAFSGALAVLAARRHQVQGAVSLAGLMAAIALWLICYALQVSGTDLSTAVFWSNAAFLAIAFVPLPWLTFALEYSGRGRWLTPLNLVLLSIVPVVTQVVAWTNKAFGLFRTDVELVARGSVWTIASNWSPWFWVHTGYSYLLILLGIVFLALRVVRSSELYRRQASILMAGAVVPLLANVLFLFVLKQSFILDPTPFTLMVTGVTLAVGLFRFKLLDVVPAARDAVVEGMSDAVLVLDTDERIVDLNPAAQIVIGRSRSETIGRPADEALAEYEDLLIRYGGVTEGQVEIDLGATGIFDMRLSTLRDRHDQPSGRLIVLRDITDRKRAEQTLQRWMQQSRVVSEVAHEVAAERGLDDLLGRTAELVRDRFGAHLVAIYLSADEGRQIVLRAASGEGAEALLGGRRQAAAARSGIAGEVLRRGTSRIVGGTESSVIYTGDVLSRVRSEAALPLRLGQRTTGVLDVYSTEEGVFDETALAVLQAVADQLALAVDNARLLEQMAGSEREAERDYRGQDLEAWRSGQVVGYRCRGEHVEPTRVLDLEAERALRDVRTVVSGPGEGYSGDTVAVPIILRDRAIGALNLRFQGGQVPAETVTLVQQVANRLALTLESARLYQDTQQRAAQERLLTEVTSRMRESLDIDTVLQNAVNEIYEALGLEEVAIQLATEDE